jgi:hypothetical protein
LTLKLSPVQIGGNRSSTTSVKKEIDHDIKPAFFPVHSHPPSTPKSTVKAEPSHILLFTPPNKGQEVIDLCSPSPDVKRKVTKGEPQSPVLLLIDDTVRIGSVFSSLLEAKDAVFVREEVRGHIWRVGQSKRDDSNEQRKVTFRCNHYYSHQPVHSIAVDPSDHREGKSVKTECNAHVNVNRRADGLWYLTTVIFEHNHPPQLVNGAKAQRPPTDAQHQTVRDLAVQPKFERRHVEHILLRDYPNHPLEPRQITNLINEARRAAQEHVKVLGGDMNAVIHTLENLSSCEMGWFYRIRLDDCQVVTGIFWQTPQQVENARCYHDILLNDSSYNRNRYQYILNLGIVINAAYQSRTVWQAIHATEDVETQNWVFQCHLQSAGKPPEVIATDRHQTLIASVKAVLPLSFHLYCLHHLSGNVTQQL